MRFSTYKAFPPFPDAVGDALETLGLSPFDPICHKELKSHSTMILTDPTRHKSWDVRQMEEARLRVRIYLKNSYPAQKLLHYSKKYAAKAKAIRDLVSAFQQCVIKHRQAPELYRTLADISRWLDQQQTGSTKPWERLPETTVKEMKRKADLIEREARSIDVCYDALYRLCRRGCRIRGPNKVILVYPRPNEVLMEWFEELQNECGWVDIPTSL